jgi:hypothetical protein
MVDVSHWQFNFINGYHFVFKVQDDTIFFHGFDTKNNVILWLINLVVLNNIRCTQRSSAQFQLFVWSETSHSKYSTTVEPTFFRKEAAWVYLCLQR